MIEPKWNKENRTRKKNSTTLKQCGWCKHRGGGNYRYNCMISGSCTLFPEYSEDREVNWNTECKIIKLGKDDLRDFIESHKREIEEAKGSIEREKEIIDILYSLIEKVKTIPCLPDNRTAKHFNLKDKVAVYDEKTNKWLFGTIVMGYRHQDGCVSFHLDGTPDPKYKYLDNSKFAKEIGKLADSPGCGFAVPTVMLKREYDYFAKHPKEWKIWKEIACSKDYNGEKIKIKMDPK